MCDPKQFVLDLIKSAFIFSLALAVESLRQKFFVISDEDSQVRSFFELSRTGKRQFEMLKITPNAREE